MEGVSSLFKVGGRVPLLKLKYYGYDFDLLFVEVPCYIPLRKEYKENLNLEDTDKLINQIIFNLKMGPIEDIRSVILPLSGSILSNVEWNNILFKGYRSNLYIAKLMEKNFENFRTLLLVLKIWAKSFSFFVLKFYLKI